MTKSYFSTGVGSRENEKSSSLSFEELVVDKLGKDPFVAYQRAIQQKLEINISNSEKLSLYVPFIRDESTASDLPNWS